MFRKLQILALTLLVALLTFSSNAFAEGDQVYVYRVVKNCTK